MCHMDVEESKVGLYLLLIKLLTVPHSIVKWKHPILFPDGKLNNVNTGALLSLHV